MDLCFYESDQRILCEPIWIKSYSHREESCPGACAYPVTAFVTTDISGHNSRQARYTAARVEGQEVPRNNPRLPQRENGRPDASDSASNGWRHFGVAFDATIVLQSA
jgi:hypothetical protein